MKWFGKKDETAELAKLNKEIAKLEVLVEEKANPAHEDIVFDQGEESRFTSRYSFSHVQSYKTLEAVNRGTNLIVDAVSEFGIDIKDKFKESKKARFVRADKLAYLLNVRANKHTSAEEFKRQIALDLILEGNAFIYFDGAELYLLPAINVEIIPDKKEFIKAYKYDNKEFFPDEIIHIRDNSADSIFRGASRLDSAVASISILNRMNKYQDNFFKNNTILGVVLKSKDMLSSKIKQRKILEWMRDYNPTSGGRKPLILDGGFEIEDLSKYTFKELDFAESIKTQEQKILEALGVPPILLYSGNNANISPNLKLFYTNTVLPLLNKIVSALEIYFGFDLKVITTNISALQPDLREQANYLSTLVNAGIMTRNEAREKLRLPASEDDIADRLILPANIAGSAIDAGTGGRPSNGGV